MSIKRALDNILEGNLDEMRQNFSSALTTKAVEKLEERKIDIAKNYFGQMQEEVEQVDEVLDSSKKRMKYGLGALGSYVKASLFYVSLKTFDIECMVTTLFECVEAESRWTIPSIKF